MSLNGLNGIDTTVAFCEASFGIQIDDAELAPENFENVAALAALVERSLANK